MTPSMQAVLSQLSFEESRAVYHALAQWADNGRNHLDETDDATADEIKAVTLVEGVVERLGEVIVAAAG